MLTIPLRRGGREYLSLDRRMLYAYTGDPVAGVCQAPALLVHRAVQELRRKSGPPTEDPAPLWPLIAAAGRHLLETELGGLTADDHARLVTLATGAPVTGVREALAEIARGLTGITEALRWQAPGGDLTAFATRRVHLPGDRSYAWVPVGRVLGFIAPSNHPSVHLTWVLALAMGWSVALRPGADDPLTPWRLALALEAAGFPMERLAILPGGHDLVPALVEACDRTVAYGGPALAPQLGRDARVLFNGPGHSKVFVDLPDAPPETVDFLMGCIAHDGGRKCTCASSVVVRGEGGAATRLLDELAAQLEALPLLDPLDPEARVPAWKDPAALASTPASPVSLGGLHFAAPALVRCAGPDAPPFGAEIPTPWATALVLDSGADPLPTLRSSLAVTLLSQDQALAESCLTAPGIQKLFVGRIPPWHTEAGAPHHGLLADFLFSAKAHRIAREELGPWN